MMPTVIFWNLANMFCELIRDQFKILLSHCICKNVLPSSDQIKYIYMHLVVLWVVFSIRIILVESIDKKKKKKRSISIQKKRFTLLCLNTVSGAEPFCSGFFICVKGLWSGIFTYWAISYSLYNNVEVNETLCEAGGYSVGEGFMVWHQKKVITSSENQLVSVCKVCWKWSSMT